MNCRPALTMALAFLAFTTLSCNRQDAPQRKQLANLKDLRDSRVLSEQEYQVKAQAIATAPSPKPVSFFGAATRTVEITDPMLNMDAATVEIPADWKFAGTVARPEGCNGGGAAIKFTAQTADGNTAVEKFPNFTWLWYSDAGMANGMKNRGCFLSPIVSASDFMKEIMIPKLRPNAQVVSIGAVAPAFQAAIAAQLEKMRQANAQMAAQYGQQPQQLRYEAARAVVSYSRNGLPVDEALVAIIQCTISYSPAMFNRPASQSNTCGTTAMAVQRAPQGKLDDMKPVFEKIGAKPNADWDQKMTQIIQQNGQRMLAAQQASGQSILKQGELAGQARMREHQAFMTEQQTRFERSQAADRAKMDAMHQSAVKTEQMSLGIQTYANPSTGTVSNASNQYNHTWQRSSDGTIIQTNDPTFDPRGSDRIDETWTEMQPVQ